MKAQLLWVFLIPPIAFVENQDIYEAEFQQDGLLHQSFEGDDAEGAAF
jgi:hypothetical protein